MTMDKNASIMVENDKGQQVELEVIDRLTLDGNEYVVVSEKTSDNAYAFKVEMKNGKKDYQSIGDGPEFAKVLKAYNLKNNS